MVTRFGIGVLSLGLLVACNVNSTAGSPNPIDGETTVRDGGSDAEHSRQLPERHRYH